MSEQYPSSGGPSDDPQHVPDDAKLPDLAPEEMARHLVAEVDDMAIDVIEALIAY